jgi:hypothetical protein
MKKFGLSFERNVTNVTDVSNDLHFKMFNETDNYVPYWKLNRSEPTKPDLNSTNHFNIDYYGNRNFHKENSIESGNVQVDEQYSNGSLFGIERNLSDYEEVLVPFNEEPEK